MRWTVIEHAGRPVTVGPSALLAAPGGTIGRSPDNHLVLPDEQRQISRLQATVRFDEDGVAVLRNMSAVLPISVNGHTLAHEQEARVADGDRVAIGSYVLEAASAQRAAPVAAAVQPPPPPPPCNSVQCQYGGPDLGCVDQIDRLGWCAAPSPPDCDCGDPFQDDQGHTICACIFPIVITP